MLSNLTTITFPSPLSPVACFVLFIGQLAGLQKSYWHDFLETLLKGVAKKKTITCWPALNSQGGFTFLNIERFEFVLNSCVVGIIRYAIYRLFCLIVLVTKTLAMI